MTPTQIAIILHNQRPVGWCQLWEEMIVRFANALEDGPGNFDRARFMDICFNGA